MTEVWLTLLDLDKAARLAHPIFEQEDWKWWVTPDHFRVPTVEEIRESMAFLVEVAQTRRRAESGRLIAENTELGMSISLQLASSAWSEDG